MQIFIEKDIFGNAIVFHNFVHNWYTDLHIGDGGSLFIGQDAQKATRKFGLKNGATHLVVGRPIRVAEDPKKAAEAIIKEMERVQ